MYLSSLHCSLVMSSLTITILCLSLCLRPGSAIKIRGKGVSSATGSLSTVDHTEVKCDYVRWRQDSRGLGKLEQFITNILNVMNTNIYNICMYIVQLPKDPLCRRSSSASSGLLNIRAWRQASFSIGMMDVSKVLHRVDLDTL